MEVHRSAEMGEHVMAIQQGIYSRIIIARFRKRQAIVLAAGSFSLALLGYHLWQIYLAPPQTAWGMSVRDRLTVCLMAFLATFVIAYTVYRCPNCNCRPVGKHWLGLNPSRCPSCKIGFR